MKHTVYLQLATRFAFIEARIDKQRQKYVSYAHKNQDNYTFQECQKEAHGVNFQQAQAHHVA